MEKATFLDMRQAILDAIVYRLRSQAATDPATATLFVSGRWSPVEEVGALAKALVDLTTAELAARREGLLREGEQVMG